jgi:hypothetical protein
MQALSVVKSAIKENMQILTPRNVELEQGLKGLFASLRRDFWCVCAWNISHLQFALKAFGSIKTITAAASVLRGQKRDPRSMLYYLRTRSLSVSAMEFLAKQVALAACMRCKRHTQHTERAN